MLSGGFSNQAQAFENPPLYGHIQVRFRPLSHLDPGSLLLEQAYAIAPSEPYRVRVLRPMQCPSRGLVILNYAIRDDQRFWGAIDDDRKDEIGESLARFVANHFLHPDVFGVGQPVSKEITSIPSAIN